MERKCAENCLKNNTINLFFIGLLQSSICVISNHNSFRVLFGETVFSIFHLKKIHLYISTGNSQRREPALCQLYRHTFVPYMLTAAVLYLRFVRSKLDVANRLRVVRGLFRVADRSPGCDFRGRASLAHPSSARVCAAARRGMTHTPIGLGSRAGARHRICLSSLRKRAMIYAPDAAAAAVLLLIFFVSSDN